MPNITDQVAKQLWKMTLKINTDDRGFTESFYLADKTEADAKTGALDIAGRIKGVLPTDAEIFLATLSKDGPSRDGLFLHTALGAGTYGTLLAVPAPSFVDQARTHLYLRMENSLNQPVTRKMGPVPDLIVTAGDVTASIPSVVGAVLAAPAVDVATDVYADRFEKLIKSIMFYTCHLKAGHTPGGGYTYETWKNAHVVRVGQKKGGHVFI